MRAMVCMLLALSVPAFGEELEGEVWYGADGEVAFVEGPAAAPVPEPFVPAWERRANERDRFEFRNDHRYRFRRSWFANGGWIGYPGWSVCRPTLFPPVHPWRPCLHPPHRGGSLIIIR